MRQLGLPDAASEAFRENGEIAMSLAPFRRTLAISRPQMERVRRFQEKTGGIVYFVIFSSTPFGDMENFLFVSDHPEEWDADRADLKAGETLAFVYNRDMPDCSELGCIGIKKARGAGLLRTW